MKLFKFSGETGIQNRKIITKFEDIETKIVKISSSEAVDTNEEVIVDLDGNVQDPLPKPTVAKIIFKKKRDAPNPPFKWIIIETDSFDKIIFANEAIKTTLSEPISFKVQIFTNGTNAEYHTYDDSYGRSHKIRFWPLTEYIDCTNGSVELLQDIYN